MNLHFGRKKILDKFLILVLVAVLSSPPRGSKGREIESGHGIGCFFSIIHVSYN
jgi:hypothetical protein